MEHEKSPLYIPMGLKEEAEIFPGFGKAELFKAIAVIVLAVVIDAIIFAIMRSVEAAVIILIMGAAVSIGLFIKDNTNSSVADKIADVLRFSKSRKKYPYILKDEWSENL